MTEQWTAHFRRLGKAVTQLRTRQDFVGAEISGLLELERTRKLTADELQRLARLRLESEGLYLELQRYWQEFEQLRQQRGKTGRTGYESS